MGAQQDELVDSSEAQQSQLAPLPSRGLSALTDLNDLEVFARVVEKSGFSRAAQELGVPASTVSRRVSRLEDALGVRLLQRTTRKMHLTEAGRTYFEQISLALRQIQSAEASLRQVQARVLERGKPRAETLDRRERVARSSGNDLSVGQPQRVLDVVREERR